MFADVLALQNALLSIEPRVFVSHHMFDRVPHAFGSERNNWINWKQTLSGLIDVDPQDIVMVGSAAVGFSLNPTKDFKEFDAMSDFDCGVISHHYFDLAWRYLRQLRVSWLSLSKEYRRAITLHRRSYVFAGTIAADSVLSLLPFGQQWQYALDTMSQMDPTKGREIKMRIYRDFESLRYYQAYGIEKLREQITSKEEEDPQGWDGIEIIGGKDEL